MTNEATTFDPAGVANELTTRIEALEAHLDSERYTTTIENALVDFGPDGRWKYAPPTEAAKARTKVEADLNRAAGVDLFRLERTILDTTPELEAAIQRAQEPLDALHAWLARKKSTQHDAHEWQSAEILGELQALRLSNELRDAAVPVVLAAYQKAVSVGDYGTQRYVENRHGRGWAGPAGSEADGRAALELSRAMAATRSARVPQSLRDAQAVLARAKKAAQKARDDARRIMPVRQDY